MLLPVVVHWVAPLGTAQVLSPLRKVVLSAVPLPSRAVPTVPLARLLALRAVRFVPEAGGKVAGKRPSGSVPVKFAASVLEQNAAAFERLAQARVAKSPSDDVVLFICAHV